MTSQMAGSKNNKSAEGVKADPNAWMITFGDLLMLLLTFFVLLLTMKSMDGGRLKEVFNQFLETHGPLEYNDTSGKPNAIEIGPWMKNYPHKYSKLISPVWTQTETFSLRRTSRPLRATSGILMRLCKRVT